MVTGASTADLAVILIDARKGVLTQTQRHSYLAHLIGIRNIVLAVNKMDLVGYDQAVFDEIVADYATFAHSIGIADFAAMPIAASRATTSLRLSPEHALVQGPALLPHLETVEVDTTTMQDRPFRMAVQWVNRPNLDFRGFSGLIASGTRQARRRHSRAAVRQDLDGRADRDLDGDLDQAVAGQSVTLTFADEVDCSPRRRDRARERPGEVADQFETTIVWMDEAEMLPGRPIG